MKTKKTPKTLLELHDVYKIYKMGTTSVYALNGVSLKIEEGDFVAIVGTSGSGKSTMMNLIGCLDKPTKGELYLDNQLLNNMSESKLARIRGQTIGFIFQQYNLIQSMSAFDNVFLSLEFLERDTVAGMRRCKEILELVGLGDKMHHRPNQLSGGQQQRVSIARCLIADPRIILADEPTGALDSKTGKEVLAMLKRLWLEQQKTIVMVTHDLNLAKHANTIIELKDGAIIQYKTNNQKINNQKINNQKKGRSKK